MDIALILEIIVSSLGGVGLFFTGIHIMSENLRRLTDHRLRGLIAAATGSARGTAALGFMSGAVMQSMNAVIGVLISLVRARAIDARRAHAVINYANLGSSVLVFLVAFKLKLAILLLLGVVGILINADRERPPESRDLIQALLGAGLLFLGLILIKEAGSLIGAQEWFRALWSGSANSLLLAFSVGAAAAFLIHSASNVAIVVIALATGGAIDLEHSIGVIYGAALGAAWSTRALGATYRGAARQLILYQMIFKILGLVPLLLLAVVEFISGTPLLLSALESLPLPIATQIAIVYFVYQVACDLTMHPLHHRVAQLIEKWAPQTAAEELGQLRYLYQGAERDPGTAILLVEQEQQRIVELLPDYLNGARSEAAPMTHDRASLHDGSRQLTEACGRFLSGLLAAASGQGGSARALVLQNRNQLLLELQDSLNELADKAERMLGANAAEAAVLMDGLIESVHALLLTLNDATRSGDPDDLAILQTLTGDRAELMHSIRSRLLASTTMETAGREALLSATSLVERLVWLMRRYALLLESSSAP